MNQRGNVHETGGTNGEADNIDAIEYFVNFPPKDASGISEEKNKIFLIQDVFWWVYLQVQL